MTVTTSTPNGFGVFTRPSPRSPWRLVVTHPDRQQAEKLLIDLAAEARHSADWCVRAVANPPPADLFTQVCEATG